MTSRNAAHNQVNVIRELARMVRASRKRSLAIVVQACRETDPGERRCLIHEANGHARWATRCEGWLFVQKRAGALVQAPNNEFYVDPVNGDDDRGDGSQFKPWRSFANAKKVKQ